MDATFEGCFEENSTQRDIPWLMWDRPIDNTIKSCVQTCRNRGFAYAALQVRFDVIKLVHYCVYVPIHRLAASVGVVRVFGEPTTKPTPVTCLALVHPGRCVVVRRQTVSTESTEVQPQI